MSEPASSAKGTDARHQMTRKVADSLGGAPETVTVSRTFSGTLLFRELPPDLKFSMEEKRALRTFARTISSRVASRRAFTCVISDDKELRELNRSFLGQDYATDVLSFPSGQPDHDLGEIIISVERAEAQAAEFGHSRIAEVQILILHGLLHLTGMDHEQDRGEMAEAEDKWRGEFGLPAALITRSKG